MEVNGLYLRLWSGCRVRHCFVQTPYAEKNPKPCLLGYSSLQAFSLCWLKTIRRLSRIGHGHFHLFTIHSCQESISLLPSLSSSIADDKAGWCPSISSPAWQRCATVPRESFVQTHAEHCHRHDGIDASVYSPPPTHTHTSRSQFHHDPTIDKARYAKGAMERDLPESRTLHLLLLVSTSLVITMVMRWWRIKSSISSFHLFSFSSRSKSDRQMFQGSKLFFYKVHQRFTSISRREPILE